MVELSRYSSYKCVNYVVYICTWSNCLATVLVSVLIVLCVSSHGWTVLLQFLQVCQLCYVSAHGRTVSLRFLCVNCVVCICTCLSTVLVSVSIVLCICTWSNHLATVFVNVSILLCPHMVEPSRYGSCKYRKCPYKSWDQWVICSTTWSTTNKTHGL